MGNLGILLTMICKPNWPEITRYILRDQNYVDKLYLAARVLRINMRDDNSYIIDEMIFNSVVGHVRVVKI